MGRVKCIATLGPATSDVEVLGRVALYVDGFRINFSHGCEDEWSKYIDTIRSLEDKLRKHFTIIGDLQGPSVRIGLMNTLQVSSNSIVYFKYCSNCSDGVPVPNREFFDVIQPGDIVLTDDGRLQLEVKRINGSGVEALALTSGFLKRGKVLVVKGKEYSFPSITEKDYNSLKFAVNKDLDYIAASYVKSPEDIKCIREILSKLNSLNVKVIAKIETRMAILNIDGIINECDYVLVARGDLGLHFNLEDIPSIQKLIIDKSIYYGKPVMVATQLLESMIENPIPTRAEVVDIYNAVLDGVDALLLTGETAVGKYPVEAVKWLRKISEKSDAGLQTINRENLSLESVKDRFALGVIRLAEDINAKVLIYTKTGLTAFRMARFKSKAEIYASSSSLKTIRQLNILHNVKPFYVEAKDYEDGLEISLKKLNELGYVSRGDMVILTYGLRDTPIHYVKIISIV
ncbi:MAG: pyruvate kinase [Candidatus Methanomethylicia archaeon]